MRRGCANLIVVFLVIAILGIRVGIAIGDYCGRRHLEQEAVKAGVAHYEADEAGAVRFVFGCPKAEVLR